MPSDLLHRQAQKFPDELFLKDDEKEITYREAEERVSRLAISLAACLPRGKSSLTVALLLHPGPDYVGVVLAAFRLRCWISLRILPLNPLKPKKVLEEEMARSGVKVCIHDHPRPPWRNSPILFYPMTKLISPPKKNFLPTPPLPYSLDLEETPFLFLFTSGSSGKSKLAAFSWKNWIRMARAGDHFLPFRRGDRWFHLLPFYHVSGMSILFRALFRGGAIVFTKKYRDDWERCLRPYRITHISLVPAQIISPDRNTLLQKLRRLSQLKSVLIGGGPIPDSLRHRLSPHSSLRPTYGLTESVAHVAIYDGSPPFQKDIPLRILSGKKVKISNGEILIHKDGLFLGYWSGRIREPWDREGWFATGDLGEKRGKHLFIRGRKDRMFISGGENIYPEEIERVILSFPGIHRAIVFPLPDKKWGKVAAAVLDQGGEGGWDERDLPSLRKHLARYLEPYKLPRQFFVLPESMRLPGKISYHTVEKSFRENRVMYPSLDI